MHFWTVVALGGVCLTAAASTNSTYITPSLPPYRNSTSMSTHYPSAPSLVSSLLSSRPASASAGNYTISHTFTTPSLTDTNGAAVSTPYHTDVADNDKIICYGDYCAAVDCHGDGCQKYRVVCRAQECRVEICIDCEFNRLVVCDAYGNDCNYAACSGDGCNRKLTCVNGICSYDACKGDECKVNCVCTNLQCVFKPCMSEECHTLIQCIDGQCENQSPAAEKLSPPPAPTWLANNGDQIWKATKSVAASETDAQAIASTDWVAQPSAAGKPSHAPAASKLTNNEDQRGMATKSVAAAATGSRAIASTGGVDQSAAAGKPPHAPAPSKPAKDGEQSGSATKPGGSAATDSHVVVAGTDKVAVGSTLALGAAVLIASVNQAFIYIDI